MLVAVWCKLAKKRFERYSQVICVNILTFLLPSVRLVVSVHRSTIAGAHCELVGQVLSLCAHASSIWHVCFETIPAMHTREEGNFRINDSISSWLLLLLESHVFHPSHNLNLVRILIDSSR